MDEPTSSLTQRETDRLFEVIDDLKRQGVAVVYISHRLAEVQRVADRVVVLRDGRNAGGLRSEEISHDAMVRADGRPRPQAVLPPPPHARRADAPVRLEVRGLTLSRAGRRRRSRSSCAAARSSAWPGWSAPAAPSWPRRCSACGTSPAAKCCSTASRCRVRHPRRRHRGRAAAGPGRPPAARPGPAGQRPAQPRAAQPRPAEHAGSGRLGRAGRETAADARPDRPGCTVKASGPHQTVGLLSGGNQQKVVLGKWLARAAARADPRRADARRGRRRPQRDLRPDGPAGRRPAWPS